MKIAVISDIHGNLHALEAVLKDARARGADRVYCAGDLVGYGPRPNEVIDVIRRENIPTVMGNYDDAVGNLRIVCGCDYKDEKTMLLGEKSIAWTRENTSEESRRWLKDLPGRMEIDPGGTALLLVHGSPRALNEYIYEDTPEDYLDYLIREGGAGILVCGHTHLPFVKKTAAGYVINAGSAGKPKHGNPNAAYVIIGPGDGWPEVEIIEVPYSYEETAAEIERAGLPPEFATAIRTGRAV